MLTVMINDVINHQVIACRLSGNVLNRVIFSETFSETIDSPSEVCQENKCSPSNRDRRGRFNDEV
jgi:hypothetical protein